MLETSVQSEGSDDLKEFLMKYESDLRHSVNPIYNVLFKIGTDKTELLEFHADDLTQTLEEEGLKKIHIVRLIKTLRKIHESQIYDDTQIKPAAVVVISSEEQKALNDITLTNRKLRENMITITNTINYLNADCKSNEECINNEFDKIINIANSRRDELLQKLMVFEKNKKDELLEQMNNIKNYDDKLAKSYDECQTMIQNTSYDASERKTTILATSGLVKGAEKWDDVKMSTTPVIKMIIRSQDLNDKLANFVDIEYIDLPKANKLSIELLSAIYNKSKFDTNILNNIFESYHKLNQFHLINGLLEQCFCKVLTIKCTQIICKHLGYNQSYIDRNYGLFNFDKTNNNNKKCNKSNNNNVYRSLCRELNADQFVGCFMDVAGRVFNILHLYYKIEAFLIKFCLENNIVSQDVNIVRKQLWIKAQTVLSGLLESLQICFKTKTKMQELLLVLDGATIFKIIGKSFSGSDSTKLSSSIRLKCIEYLDHFKKTFFESIKTKFDNEMWVVLPIPPNFGVHSIEELHRNTQRTLIGSDYDKNGENVYQMFLSGDNIFDKLMQNQRKDDTEGKTTASHTFDDDNALNLNVVSISCSSDNDTKPCVTATSLLLAKYIGKCLQIMERLHPVSYDAILALQDLFKFYLYHVFIWFGVNIHNFFEIQESEVTSIFDGWIYDKTQETKRKEMILSVAQKKYPILTRIINEVNELLLSGKLAPALEEKNNTERPRTLPPFAKCYMKASEELELASPSTMQGVAARFVATETLTFLVNVIKSQRGRLMNILNKDDSNYTKDVSSFIEQIENVVIEFKNYMYRNVPTLLVHLGSPHNKDSIISHIINTNWNIKSLTTKPNNYVYELIEMFIKIENVLSSFPTLPKFINNRLNKEAIEYVEEQLVAAYADIGRYYKKCTTEGRSLMSLDVSVLKKTYPISKYNHSWQYISNFIDAYYLSQQQLIKWIKQHPQYPLKVYKSFLKIGRVSETLRRKELKSFEQEIEKIYKESKLKQSSNEINLLLTECKDTPDS